MAFRGQSAADLKAPTVRTALFDVTETGLAIFPGSGNTFRGTCGRPWRCLGGDYEMYGQAGKLCFQNLWGQCPFGGCIWSYLRFSWILVSERFFAVLFAFQSFARVLGIFLNLLRIGLGRHLELFGLQGGMVSSLVLWESSRVATWGLKSASLCVSGSPNTQRCDNTRSVSAIELT